MKYVVSRSRRVLAFLVVALATVATVGSARAQLFTLTHTFDDPTPTIQDAFGASVSLGAGWALVGAPGDDTNRIFSGNSGQAHLFDVATGAMHHTLDLPALGFEGDSFGQAVAVAGDYLIVGAPDNTSPLTERGRADRFNSMTGASEGAFDRSAFSDLRNNFGNAVDADQGVALIGARTDSEYGGLVGAAALFDVDTGEMLYLLSDPTPTDADVFGTSVAIDGTYAVVGAPTDDTLATQAGQVHIFDVESGNLLHTLENPALGTFYLFGQSVAVHGDRILVGAPYGERGSRAVGEAFLFDATTGDLLRTLNDPTPTGEDGFGYAVALNEKYLVIGARSDSTIGEYLGQVHVFDATTGALLQTLDAPNPTGLDNFGGALALNGDWLLVGASGNDSLGDGVGQAYLFTAVPEPSAAMLLVAALAMSGLAMRCKR